MNKFFSFWGIFLSLNFGIAQTPSSYFVPNIGQIDLNESTDYPIAYVELPLAKVYILENGLRISVINIKDKPNIHKAFHYKGLDTQFTVNYQVFDIRMKHSLVPTSIKFSEDAPYYLNFYLGSNPEKWKSGVTPSNKITISNVYPKIDWVVYIKDNQIEFDWVLHKGADPNLIKVDFAGMDSLLFLNNTLQLCSKNGNFTINPPRTYQQKNKNKLHEIKCNYKKLGSTLFGFELGSYDSLKTLIIDPVLVFSTYSGSQADNFGFTATYDTAGNLFAGGIADANIRNYPVTTGSFQTIYGGSNNGADPVNLPCDISISKYSSDGRKLLYATYLGGNNDDYPHSICTDIHNNLLLLGSTLSNNFPIHKDSFIQNTNQGNYDIVIVKLNPDGTKLLGSTYLGGTNQDGFQNNSGAFKSQLLYNYADNYRGDINSDLDGNVYIATCSRSTNLNAIKPGFQSTNKGRTDALILSLSPNLSFVRWSTFLGGNEDDAAYSCRFDDSDNLFISGGTNSQNFPIVGKKPIQNLNFGNIDGFIVKFDKNFGIYKVGTFWGTNQYDQIYFVDLDRDGKVYFTGQTEGSINISPNVYGNNNAHQFIGRISNNLDSLEFITTFGNTNKSNPDLSPSAFMVDDCYNIYFSGWGSEIGIGNIGTTNGLEITNDAHQKLTDGNDFYLLALSKDAKNLQYASYFGGDQSGDHVDGGTSRFDKRGIVYQSVCASCPENPPGLNDFPTTSDAVFKNNISIRCSNASFKLDFRLGYSIDAQFTSPIKICLNGQSKFQPLTEYKANYLWDFGDGTTSTEFAPTHTFKKTGEYTIKLTVTDTNSCNVNAKYQRKINIIEAPEAVVETSIESCKSGVIFEAKGTFFDSIIWDFGDGSNLKFNDNPTIHEYSPGNFNARAIFKNTITHCIDTFNIVISDTSFKPKELLISNVFTPNNDNKNDCFEVLGFSKECDEIELYIYNRWGERVFKTSDLSICWNGKVDNVGPELPTGTYFYILKIIKSSNSNSPNQINGSINLIRNN